MAHHVINFVLYFQFGFGGMYPHEVPGTFKATYRCYSVSMLPGNERLDVEKGGKSKLKNKNKTYTKNMLESCAYSTTEVSFLIFI